MKIFRVVIFELRQKWTVKKKIFHITIQGPLIRCFKNDSAIGRFADVKGIGENISAGVIDCMV